MSPAPAIDADVDALVGTLKASRIYDLEQPRYAGTPGFAAHAPGFVYALHRRHEAGLAEARTSASGLLIMADHSGTHIDALCHQAEHQQLFGGRKVHAGLQTSSGFTELGVETIAPMIARGILLDVGGQAPRPDRGSIDRVDLEKAAATEGVSISEGDVVLVRTGAGALWKQPRDYERAAGMAKDASDWLAERGVLAVGADNLAWDGLGTREVDGTTLPGHVVLMVRAGIYIIENLFLEDLARDRRYEFLFVCLPLKMTGATGSPVRPIAIVPAKSTS